MENLKNTNSIALAIASVCFTLFIVGRLGWVGFSAKMTYAFGSIAFGILSIFALVAILSRNKK